MQTCQQCGESNPPRARYCMACGTSLAPSARTEEIRRVTVLFADIVSSTALISGIDPEDARALLDSVVWRLRAAVRQFDGSVARVAGDGIKVLFGAPIALEDHARRACLAALRMQADLSSLAALGADASDRPTVRVRIGINTGNVLMRSVASDLHVEYSAEGETTHLAAKAQQAADPGAILVTAEVARLVQGYIEMRAREPLRVPGLAEPVVVYELLGVTSAQSRFQVAVGRGLTDFVGREPELAQLEAAAGRARAGALVGVGIVGEAGVGKSRVLWEFGERLDAQGWAVFRAQATLGGTALAFHPLLVVLRAMHGFEPGDDATALRRKLPPDSGVDVTPLLVLFDLPAGDPSWDALDARERLDRTHRALIAGLLAGCRGRPTAVMINDLHEADAETRGLVKLLLRQAHAERLLLLLEYRPIDGMDLGPATGFQALRIDALQAASAVALFRRLAGTDASLARLERQLVERGAGNPFFIEEGVRALRESGVLIGSPGHDVASAAQRDLPIPGSVADMIESRIARLDASQREALLMAAVLGKEVRLPMLRRLVSHGLDLLTQSLARLVDAGLLVTGSQAASGEFAFKHAVTQDVAYRILKKSERQAAHARVVTLLESQSLSALPDRTELLAHHALRAQQWVRAIDYLQRAAQRAAERSALNEAVRLLGEALDAVRWLEPTRQSVEREVDLRLAMRGPLLTLGNITRLGDEVRRLENLAPACGDGPRLGRLAVFICGHRWLSGEHALAVEAGRRAIEHATRHDDFSVLVPARQYVGGALHELGQFADAEALLSANIDSVPEDAPGHTFGMAGLPAVFCRATRGWLYGHLGRIAEAQRDADGALRIGEATGHTFSIMSATFTAAALCVGRAEFDRAAPLLERGLSLCDAKRQRMWGPVIGAMLALVIAEQGQVERARSLIDKTVARPDDPVLTTYIALTVARAYLAIGRLDHAARLTDATLGRAQRLGERLWEAEALLLRGALAQGAAASAGIHAALQLARQLGLPPLVARCHLALATALGADGDLNGAAQQRALAAAQFTALGMTAWLARSAPHAPAAMRAQ